MSRHVIRLRGPWNYEAVARSLESDRSGVRCTRRFNCPTNLDPLERVWLVFDGLEREARVTLNDQPLGELGSPAPLHELEITPVLLEHNVLAVEVSLRPEELADIEVRGRRAGGAGGLFGEVRLEIGRA
jgi:hypothetical protein